MYEEKKMMEKRITPDMQWLHNRALYVLENFKRLRVSRYDHYNGLFSLMRTMFVPREQEGFFSDEDALDGYSYKSHSPEPHLIVRKAVSYTMSYLYSMSENFHKITLNKFETQKKPKADVDRQQFLEGLTKDNHQVYQAHLNLFHQSHVKRDCMVFGFGAKVVEHDDLNISLYKHIIPENLLVGSSIGNLNDVVGYVSYKNYFEAYQTLGEPLFVREGYKRPVTDFADEFLLNNDRDISHSGTNDYEGRANNSTQADDYYRINIPYKVFETLCLSGKSWVDKTERERSRLKKKFNNLFYRPVIKGLTSKDTGILDVWFSRNEVFEPKVLRTHNIILSGMFLGDKSTSLAQGFGQESQGLMLAFAEIFLQNVDAYQRMNLPPYVFFGEDQDYAVNVGPLGAIFAKNEQTIAPSVLNYPGNIDGMIKFWQELVRQMREAWHINDFELIKQTHMTVDEVGKRSTEGYRALTVSTIIDSLFDLVPTSLANINNLYINSDNKENFKDTIFDVRFRSPLTNAHKNSFINSVDLSLDMMMKYAKAKRLFPDAMMKFDDDEITTKLTDNLGVIEILKSSEQYNASLQERAQEKNLRDQLNIARSMQGKGDVPPDKEQGQGQGQGGMNIGGSSRQAGQGENRGGFRTQS